MLLSTAVISLIKRGAFVLISVSSSVNASCPISVSRLVRLSIISNSEFSIASRAIDFLNNVSSVFPIRMFDILK